MKSRPKGRRADRIVRHTLADGTVREYRYAPHRPKPAGRAASDSIAHLIAAYQRSPEWNRLAAATRTNYQIYLRSLDRVGYVRVPEVRRRDLLAVRDAIAATRGHGAATGFIRAASALFAWGVDREWLDFNPAHRGTKGLDRGHLPAWTKEAADAALAGLPEPLRRVVVLALYTGARRGDLCRMPWSAYDSTALRFVPQKTRRIAPDPLVVPCHPALKAELDAWKAVRADAITILTDARGKPWNPTLLSHALPTALAKLGLPGELNVHGLRKLAATNLAEAGCSTHEIAAITGHRTLGMVQLYTRSVDQERLAGAAIIRLTATKKR